MSLHYQEADLVRQIIQLTDIHFAVENKKSSCKQDSNKQLLVTLEHINHNILGDKIIILTGDLVLDPEPYLYKELAKILSTIDSQIYCIAGNHDDSVILKNHFLAPNIRHVDNLSIGNWLVLLLDSSTPGINLGSGKLLKEHLEKLEHDLDINKNKDIVIFIHHPPMLFGAQWFQKICLENKDDFNKIINNHNNIKAVIFGHAHTQCSLYMNNKLFICSPSTWVQFDHNHDNNFVYKETAPGYNWYKLYGDGSIFFGTCYVELS